MGLTLQILLANRARAIAIQGQGNRLGNVYGCKNPDPEAYFETVRSLLAKTYVVT